MYAGCSVSLSACFPPSLGGGAQHTLLSPLPPQVLEWVRATVDAHLARLMTSQRASASLASLQRALATQVEACQKLLPLQGAAEHMRSGATLPAAHMASAMQYTIELVDLTIRAPS